MDLNWTEILPKSNRRYAQASSLLWLVELALRDTQRAIWKPTSCSHYQKCIELRLFPNHLKEAIACANAEEQGYSDANWPIWCIGIDTMVGGHD